MFQDRKEVYLIFTSQGSAYFQGVAKLVNNDGHLISCSQMPLEWVKIGNLPFQATRHLFNALDKNRRVQLSRDGQVSQKFLFLLAFFRL